MFSIAFEGCACRAAFHIGVARWFDEQGLVPEVIAGASSGSLVAAAWAVGDLEALEARWLDFMLTKRPFDLSVLPRWPGRMSHILREGLEQDHGAVTMEQVPKLRIAVTRIGLWGTRTVTLHGTALPVVDAILASCFIPGPYSQLPFIDGRPAADGAWKERVPLRSLPVGRRIAVVSGFTGELTGGLVPPTTLQVPSDVRVLHPEQPLRAQGFVFDRDAAVEGIAAGRAAAQGFARAQSAWLGL